MDQQLNALAKQTNGIMIEGDISPLTAEKVYQYLSKIETKKLEEKAAGDKNRSLSLVFIYCFNILID